MTSDENHKPHDPLDRAIAALHATPIPDGPPPQLVASTLAALPSGTGSPATIHTQERRRDMFRIVTYSGAVAAAIIAAIAGLVFFLDSRPQFAFADVIKNVNDSKSVTFITKMPTIVQGTRRGVLQQKFYIQGDSYRMEIPSAQEDIQAPPDAPPIVAVLIADWQQRKAILLDYTTKTAKMIETDEKTWNGMAKAMADPVKQLRQLKEQDAERLADEDLNGVKMQVYRLKKKEIFMGLTQSPDESAKLWVDPKTGLPARIAQGEIGDKDKPFCIFEQFAWNEKLDPNLFKLEIPQGFTLKDK